MVEQRSAPVNTVSVSRVYVLILNWNGWKDTIECLESVFRNEAKDYRVIVCDNDSQDDSVAHIKAWAEGRLDVALRPNDGLRALSFPPVNKPINFVEYNRGTAETGGDSDRDDVKLVLIATGGNLGFAGGNNVGLRYALARDDFDYVWLLNNDTVIKCDALEHMIARMQRMPSAGVCGSTLFYYSMPDIVQACGGGTYNKWLGTTQMLGSFSPIGSVSADIVEDKLIFVAGASMLVSRAFLQQIGLMEEKYFLYYEEIDWSTRAGKRFRLCYAQDSLVYHKEGSSIGTNSTEPHKKSLTADYYGVRSRLIFASLFYPRYLAFIYVGLIPVFINRIRRKQWRHINMLLSLVFGNWRRDDH
jgi:GT2 family glycosyltransferase